MVHSVMGSLLLSVVSTGIGSDALITMAFIHVGIFEALLFPFRSLSFKRA